MEINKTIIKKLLKNRLKTPADLVGFKRKISKEYGISLFSNMEILKEYRRLVKNGEIKRNEALENLLTTRKIRSLSGIVVVSVLTKPYPCPGKCLYCPAEKGIPKSYISGEPAVMRAVANRFHPYRQAQARLRALERAGHPVGKVDLRIIGGTWSFYPKQYQSWFVKKCFQAANDFPAEKRRRAGSLPAEQKRNEKAKCRVVGITIETRPDYIDKKEIKRLRELGVTRVELGIQSVYDDVLRKNRRGHKIRDAVRATRLLRDAGFKICYQIMPDLPGSSFARDLSMFGELFSNPDFRPDMLKIYPTAVLKEAPLWKERAKLNYRPLSAAKLAELLKEAKKRIPPYCRVQRIIRDFSSRRIAAGAGAKISNLRQLAAAKLAEEGRRCRCVRCREVKGDYDPNEKIFLFRRDYEAAAGKEVFLSFEDAGRRKLYGLLRLRAPSLPGSPLFSALRGAAVVRALRVYGRLVPVGGKGRFPQHKGLGKKLIKKAEKITFKDFGLKKIAVISGIGARGYFRRLGYKLEGTYMVKNQKNLCGGKNKPIIKARSEKQHNANVRIYANPRKCKLEIL